MIEARSISEGYLDDGFLSLAEELYKAKFLLVSRVSYKERTLGITLVLRRDEQYMFWIDLFRPKNEEKTINDYLLLVCFLDSQSAKGKFDLSLGRGTNAYKINNFAPEIENLYRVYYARPLRKVVASASWMLLRDFLRPFYRKRIKPWIVTTRRGGV